MDFNQMPLGLGIAYVSNRVAMDKFTDMSDDEKREYIERNRSSLSDDELESLTASLGEDAEDKPEYKNPMSMFYGPGIG